MSNEERNEIVMKYWQDNEEKSWKESLTEDVLITAVNGGINYWAEVRETPDKLKQHAVMVTVFDSEIGDFVCDEKYMLARFSETFGDYTVLVNQDLISDGLGRLAEASELNEGSEVQLLSVAVARLLSSDGWDQEETYNRLDASGADIVVQYALFGEVVFGQHYQD